jgi:hypothetical protein
MSAYSLQASKDRPNALSRKPRHVSAVKDAR